MNYLPTDPLNLYNWTCAGDSPYAVLVSDQQKANFAWLIYGKQMESDLMSLPDAFVSDVVNSFDKETRHHLTRMPKEFVSYWRGVMNQSQRDSPIITSHAPDGYYHSMVLNANVAQARLLGKVEHGNVVTVNFRRSA